MTKTTAIKKGAVDLHGDGCLWIVDGPNSYLVWESAAKKAEREAMRIAAETAAAAAETTIA